MPTPVLGVGIAVSGGDMFRFYDLNPSQREWALKQCFDQLLEAISCGMLALPEPRLHTKIYLWAKELKQLTDTDHVIELQKKISDDTEICSVILMMAEEDAQKSVYVENDVPVIVLPRGLT